MSDTVYEKNGVSFTRYWGGFKGDCIQVTVLNPEKYACLTLAQFWQAVKAIEKNVESTQDAWWHGNKEGGDAR